MHYNQICTQLKLCNQLNQNIILVEARVPGDTATVGTGLINASFVDWGNGVKHYWQPLTVPTTISDLWWYKRCVYVYCNIEEAHQYLKVVRCRTISGKLKSIPSKHGWQYKMSKT